MVCNMSKAQRKISGVLVVALFSFIVYLNMNQEFNWMTMFVPFIGALIAIAFLETSISNDTWTTAIYFALAIVLLALYIYIGLWVVTLFLVSLLFLGHIFEK